MKHGIANISVIPVRKEPAEQSEMLTQLLFGEHFEIINTIEKWAQVRLAYDNYKGWIDYKMIYFISKYLFEQLNQFPSLTSTETFNYVSQPQKKLTILIAAGSSLPFFDKKKKTFKISDEIYEYFDDIPENFPKDIRSSITYNAIKYINSPYLWGGRTPFGIDCSGLSQNVYKMSSIKIPRDASQQARAGKTISIENIQPGDLAFFDDENHACRQAGGKITHVGILLEKNKIIHASGKVRIDTFDHKGIFNTDTKKYTHKLKTIKNICNYSTCEKC